MSLWCSYTVVHLGLLDFCFASLFCQTWQFSPWNNFFLKHRASFIHTVVKFLIMTMVIYVAENLANRFQNSVVHSAWCLVKGCCHCWLLPVEYRLAWSICLSGPDVVVLWIFCPLKQLLWKGDRLLVAIILFLSCSHSLCLFYKTFQSQEFSKDKSPLHWLVLKLSANTHLNTKHQEIISKAKENDTK